MAKSEEDELSWFDNPIGGPSWVSYPVSMSAGFCGHGLRKVGQDEDVLLSSYSPIRYASSLSESEPSSRPSPIPVPLRTFSAAAPELAATRIASLTWTLGPGTIAIAANPRTEVVSPVSRRVSQLSRLAKGTNVSMASCTSITSRT